MADRPERAIAVPVTDDARPHDGPFDRRLRRLRRNRAAMQGGADAFLFRHMADELLARLDLVTRPFADALDLGCAGGQLGAALRQRGLAVTSADAGRLFAQAGVQCDEDRLPFAPASFDLVVSAGALDTVNDLPGALIQIRRALRPDGLFLGAFVGAGSLPRLRSALRAAEAAQGLPAGARIHPQIDVRAAGDLLGRAGFALPVADEEALTVRYSRFDRLIGDLRAMAGTNLLHARARQGFGRTGLAAAIADFAAGADADGKVPEQFRIVHVAGWAPGPDQPRPAARGSGSVSLADALKSPRP